MRTVLTNVDMEDHDLAPPGDGARDPSRDPEQRPTGPRPDRPRRSGAHGGMALVLAVVLIGGAGEPAAAQQADPGAFLQAMAGEWVVDSEGIPGPGEDPVRGESREVARLLGGQWLVAEGNAVMPDGRRYDSIWILGWDPHEEHFVGSWVVSVQTYKWRHVGTLDESGRVLTLETEGPFMGDRSTTTRYREIIELVDDDHRVLRSLILVPDGDWFEFARAEYRRVGAEGG